METISPVWVVIRATEIPSAMARALPVPNTVITSKVRIMPSNGSQQPQQRATETDPDDPQVLVQLPGQAQTTRPGKIARPRAKCAGKKVAHLGG